MVSISLSPVNAAAATGIGPMDDSIVPVSLPSTTLKSLRSDTSPLGVCADPSQAPVNDSSVTG